jgi:hypothetical protein
MRGPGTRRVLARGSGVYGGQRKSIAVAFSHTRFDEIAMMANARGLPMGEFLRLLVEQALTTKES